MKNRKQKVMMSRARLVLFSALISSLAIVQPVQADDIEIYEAIANAENAAGDKNSDPNVLFILDNSGSMKAFRLIKEATTGTTVEPYDPTKIYGESGVVNEDYYVYNTNMRLVTKILKSQNVCKAALDTFSANPNDPRHLDKYTQWTRSRRNWNYSRWSRNSLIFSDRDQTKLECEDDLGSHGVDDSSAAKHPRFCGNRGWCYKPDGQPMYANSPQYRNGRVWPYGGINEQNYLVTGNYHEYLKTIPATADVSNCVNNDDILVDPATGINYRCLRKLEIMKRALIKVVGGDTSNPADKGLQKINLGLMRFNYNEGYTDSGGTLVDAIAQSDAHTVPGDTNSPTNKDDFIAKVKNIDFEGWTPLSESMYEAYRYFAGWTPKSSEATSNQDALDSSAVDGGSFISPRGTNQCQGNYVVMLSDGEPTRDRYFESDIESLNGVGTCSGNCLDETSKALKDNLGVYTYTIGFDADIQVLKDAARKGSPNENAVDGDGYFLADDIDSLEQVFQRILTEIQLVDNDSFVAPAVTVNAFSRLENREDLYYALFKPDADPRWNGNLKKYKLAVVKKYDKDGNYYGDEIGITDVKMTDDVVSEETGFFIDEAQSFWSDDVDGPDVEKGGMASELPSQRKLFASLDTSSNAVTYLGNTNTAANNNGPVNFAKAVSGIDNTGQVLGVDTDLAGDVSAVTAGQFANRYAKLLADGTTGDLRVDNFLNIARWTLGEDIDNEVGVDTDYRTPNQFIGESLHSTPTLISFGATTAQSKDIIFYTSNQGMLHAVAGVEPTAGGFAGRKGGQELWSYIPDPSLLKNLGGYYNNKLNGRSDVKDHIYGLDAPMSRKVTRKSTTNPATNNTVDEAILYFGQRRGGNRYFAVDVSKAYVAPSVSAKPVEKLWTAQGGVGNLKRLAQTWAAPVMTKIRCYDSSTGCDNGKRDVLVVSGGYDPKYDDESKTLEQLANNPTTGSNTLGNAIYVLDADTGKVIWVATNSAANAGTVADKVIVAEMKHSILSRPTVMDVNGDGAIDIIFAIDISGQMFRFDTRRGASSEQYSGGLIASLQENGVKRRFYNPIDIALLEKSADGAPVRYALTTGSGYRAHPLLSENVANRFYVVYDRFVRGASSYKYIGNQEAGNGTVSNGSRTIAFGDLQEVPLIYDKDNNLQLLKPNTDHKYGYYTELKNQSSEKILNPSLITSNKALVVTYKPSDGTENTNKCSANAGNSFVYIFNLLTGELANEVIKLNKPGLSPGAKIPYRRDDDDDNKFKNPIVIGTQVLCPDGKPANGRICPPKPKCYREGDDICPPDDIGKAKKRAWWEMFRRN